LTVLDLAPSQVTSAAALHWTPVLPPAPAALAITTTAPTVLGQPTVLAATIAAGNYVYYNWDLGDGSPLVAGYENTRRRFWLTHTYPAP
jgi:hypothetical protein